jgi:D-alanyl-D-alanine carboxypeptidase/D-alanyl-D-alanine-endopeptidase (penicillin-binding protein 4)
VALARLVVEETGLQEVTGRLVGDESAFDARRGPPSSGYNTSGYVGPLSALAFNRGLTGVIRPYFQASPGLFATQAFERALKAEGVAFGGKPRMGAAPAAATALAAAMSPTVAELVTRTNVPSDNYFAETLIKVLGARLGGAGTTRAGARVVRDTMREMGLNPRVSDGSGLGRANRTSPRQVVALLRTMARDPLIGPTFEASLPVAGRTGTLTGRMRGTAAFGKCRAKTGSLNSVSALAGYCVARDGVTKVAFAILMNRVDVYGARRLQDRMAAALARYEP